MKDFFLCSGDNLSKVPASPYCNRNLLVVVVGPTGAGKSDLALRIAEVLDGEIVNCDSMQIYRGLDIGTAKLSPAERRGVPHHLLDIVEPAQIFSAGDYARAARATIDEITKRGRAPIVVGGTGFYLRALLEGLPDLPSRNPCLRRRLERRDPEQLHRLLGRLDPASAARLHPNDRMRVIRAIEIRLLAGGPAPPLCPGSVLTEFRIEKIGLFPPREELYRRLNERTAEMFRKGLVGEVRNLLDSGIPVSAKAFEGVGYRETLAVIEGKSTEPEAISETQRATRNYAKRQITWFRRDRALRPFPRFGSEVGVESLAFLTGSP